MKRKLTTAILLVMLGLTLSATLTANFAVAGFSLTNPQYNNMFFWLIVAASAGLMLAGVVILIFAVAPRIGSTFSQPPATGAWAAKQFFQPSTGYPRQGNSRMYLPPTQCYPSTYGVRYRPWYPYYSYYQYNQYNLYSRRY